MPRASRLTKVFTPSFADEDGTNAQNLTVKEVVARLDPERFHVAMFYDRRPDPRIAARPNTALWPWRSRGNTLRTLVRIAHDVPDIYFFPREGPLEARFYTLRRWLRWRTRVVTYMVSGGLERRGPAPGQLLNLREASAVAGNCATITQLLRGMGFAATTIHDGVDRRFYFPPHERPVRDHRSLVALCAGSFRPYKRFDLVVRQAAQWPQVEFRIAGHGEEEESCRKLARDLGCGNVRFLGHLGQGALGEEMRHADIFLFPSELEGHPQVLLQAAASGLPCVAMNSYRPDAIVDGETGFLAGSAEELAEKFAILVRDAGRRLAMSQAALRHAAEFDWDKATRLWAEAFERAMEERP